MLLKTVDIGAELGRGWRLFQANMGVLILAGLLATVVAVLTCGILAGPLAAGMLLVAQRLLKGDPIKPQAGDVFKGFDFFVQSLILIVLAMVTGLVLGMIPVIGQLAGLVIGAVVMWGLIFVTYQRLTALDALKKIFELTKSGQFTMPLVFAVLACLISGLGAIACLVGIFFTIPLSYCMMACCYETLFSDEPEIIEPIRDDAPPPPPADLRQ